MNSLKGKRVNFSKDYLNVMLSDGRIISTPLSWYPELQKATLKQLKNYKFICRGKGIEWEDIDYHLSLESMLVSDSIKMNRVA